MNAWQIICWTSQGARTHLFHVGRDKALRIVAHGYAMTIDRLASMGVPSEDLGRHWHDWLGAEVTAGLPDVAWQETVLDREAWSKLPHGQR